MVKVISFCLYGNDPKYTVGLAKNLSLIPPGYEAWVYLGSDVESVDLPGARVFRCDFTGQRLTFERFRPLQDPSVEICFIRDADSRILERDRWCMKEFEASDRTVHIIRDHYWHKSRIMAGMWGAKVGTPIGDWEAWMEGKEYKYGMEEVYLAERVYPNCRPLIHSSIVGFPGEEITLIDLPETDDFVGQVYDADDRPLFRYRNFPFAEHMRWLIARDQWKILRHNLSVPRVMTFPVSERAALLFGLFQACFYMKDYTSAQEVLEGYRYALVGEHEIHQTSFLIPHLGKRIIGTTNPDRVPEHDEIVILYGNFLHSVDALPLRRNHVYRHAQYVNLVRHDVFEFDPAWKSIDTIYIMNLETRRDRYIETLAELARMRAPLERIFHYKGKPSPNPLIGATQNHVDCLRHFVKSGKGAALFLEDDFTFTSRVDHHLNDLGRFFARGYDYDLCLLSTSRFYERKPYDDLLDLSYQECTTSAGYIVSNSSGPEVLRVVEEGLRKIEAGDTQGVVDRYWAILQPRNKFFVFREKMGYQRCGYSNIKNTVTAFFD